MGLLHNEIILWKCIDELDWLTLLSVEFVGLTQESNRVSKGYRVDKIKNFNLQKIHVEISMKNIFLLVAE